MQNDSEPRDFPGKLSSVLSQANKPGEVRQSQEKPGGFPAMMLASGLEEVCRWSRKHKC